MAYKRKPLKLCPLCGGRARRTESVGYVSTDGRALVMRRWIHAQYGFRQGAPCVVLRLSANDKHENWWTKLPEDKRL